MALAPQNISKFRVNKVNAEKSRGLYKEVDFAHFHDVFPNLQSYKMLDPNMKQILATARPNIIGEDGTLMKAFQDHAVIEDWYQDTIIWRLYTTESDIRPTVVSNYETGEYSGLRGAPIRIGLDTDALGPNDTIAFEDMRTVQFLIISEPVPNGSHVWDYEVVIAADDIDAVDNFQDRVPVGTQVIQSISPIPEDTTHRGNVILTDVGHSYLEFETMMGRVGWSLKITDKAWLAAKDFVLKPDCKEAEDYMSDNGFGGKDGILGNDLEMAFITATNRLKDFHLIYGRTNGHLVGNHLDPYNHRPLNIPGGLFQFLEQGIIREFNPNTKDGFGMFAETFKPAWLNKVSPEDTVVHVFTGSGGMELIQRWAEYADKKPIQHTEETNYEFTDDVYNQGRKGVIINKKQYRGYFIEPYGKVIFHVLPFLDNTSISSSKKRYNGWPIESYQFLVFDFGYGDAREGKNIRIFENPHVEQIGYGGGTWSTSGGALGKPPAYVTTLPGENAYEIIRESSLGFLIKDISSLMWFVPAIKL